MYKNILVPLDGSTLAERSLEYALPLAERHGAEVTLIRVTEPIFPIMAGGGAPVRDPALDQERREQDRKYLQKIVRRVRRSSDVPVDGVFLEGKVVPTVAGYVRDNKIDLVVMSTHGRGGFERLWLGSVADGMIRELPADLLLVRVGRNAHRPVAGETLFPRVLVPLDGSVPAEGALDSVIKLVGRDSATITLGCVVHPVLAMASKTTPSREENELREGYLKPIVARYTAPNLVFNIDLKVDGNTGRALIDMVKRSDSSLISLATHGRGGMGRFLLGSVADKLIRTAPVPVLISDRPAAD